jgi:F-type H+-transporting ATPase subunit epsilon
MAKLSVHVVTPEREVFVGEADMVVARTTSGDVGILPGHIPMLVPLAIGVLAIVEGGTRTQAAVDGGFLHVTGSGEETRVDVLAEHAELATEIDASRVAQEREAAERRVTDEPSPEARAELAKAATRARITGS